MYILDTCILNILFFYPGAKREALTRRLGTVDEEDVFISDISVYELIGLGAVPEVNRAINTIEAPRKLDALTKLVGLLWEFSILEFTSEDHTRYVGMDASIKRKGQMDARIAASAISRDFLVVTEDTEVFALAGARYEDWTREIA